MMTLRKTGRRGKCLPFLPSRKAESVRAIWCFCVSFIIWVSVWWRWPGIIPMSWGIRTAWHRTAAISHPTERMTPYLDWQKKESSSWRRWSAWAWSWMFPIWMMPVSGMWSGIRKNHLLPAIPMPVPWFRIVQGIWLMTWSVRYRSVVVLPESTIFRHF